MLTPIEYENLHRNRSIADSESNDVNTRDPGHINPTGCGHLARSQPQGQGVRSRRRLGRMRGAEGGREVGPAEFHRHGGPLALPSVVGRWGVLVDEEFGPAALAIYTGEVDELRSLLTADAGLATRTSSVGHPTLLQLVACEESRIGDPVGAAAALVEAGAATHSPLVSAAGCGSREVLEFLLDRGAPINGEDPLWSPLDEAVYWANLDIAERLLERGAGVRALSTAAGLGDLGAIERFFGETGLVPDAGPIGSPFPDTIPAGLADDPESIIDHAFVMAVNTGLREAAERILGVGADVNAKPPGYHWRGTGLHAAIWRGHRGLVEWLLTVGADPTIRDGMVDSDAAGWAVHHGHRDLAELLGVVDQ